MTDRYRVKKYVYKRDTVYRYFNSIESVFVYVANNITGIYMVNEDYTAYPTFSIDIWSEDGWVDVTYIPSWYRKD